MMHSNNPIDFNTLDKNFDLQETEDKRRSKMFSSKPSGGGGFSSQSSSSTQSSSEDTESSEPSQSSNPPTEEPEEAEEQIVSLTNTHFMTPEEVAITIDTDISVNVEYLTDRQPKEMQFQVQAIYNGETEIVVSGSPVTSKEITIRESVPL